jgi:alpha-methylacyl-CoA racemase
MSTGPLQNTKILEFEGLGPAPFCAMVLAGLGADILRIARSGQRARSETGDAIILRGRPSVAANLKNPADLLQIQALIQAADVLIEGYRPGVMERLGLGPETCLAANKRLVYARMTGWGQTGPLAPRAGHDINYISLTGALHAMGKPGEPPPVPLNLVGDYGGGAMFLATGILAALLHARATGQGQVVDAAMTDGTATLMSLFQAMSQAGAWTETRHANLLDGGAPFYRCYACADGGFVAVGAIEPQFFAILVRVMGIDFPPENQYNRSTWPDLTARLEQTFLEKPRDAWAEIFAPEDACVTPVLTLAEAPKHPHNVARDTYVTTNGFTQPAPAPRFSNSMPPPPASAAPLTLDAAIARWQNA